MGMTYQKDLDIGDVGDYATFFAAQSDVYPSKWSYIYGLTLPSTWREGSSGMVGDGIDYDLSSGILEIPAEVIDAGDEESWLDDFAYENEPSIPESVLEEFEYDRRLGDISEIVRLDGVSLRDAFLEELGEEDFDDYLEEDFDRLMEYAHGHGWSF